MTARNAFEGQITPCGRTVPGQRLHTVSRTRWGKSTRGTQPWAQQQAIGFDQPDQQTFHVVISALSNNCCNSKRTAVFNAADVALVKMRESNAFRNLTTRSLAGCDHR